MMTVVIVLLSALLDSSQGCSVRTGVTVETTDGYVRLGDMLESGCFAEGAPAPGKIVASLPPNRARAQFDCRQIVALAGRRLPEATIACATDGESLLTVLRDEPGQTAIASRCFQLGSPVRAGDPVWREDLVVAECAADRSDGVLVFERAMGEVRAVRDLREGQYLGRVALPERPYARRGDSLVLVSRRGPFSIEREVVLLQDARAGERAFVRDGAGGILSVPLVEMTSGAGQ